MLFLRRHGNRVAGVKGRDRYAVLTTRPTESEGVVNTMDLSFRKQKKNKRILKKGFRLKLLSHHIIIEKKG